MGNTASKHKKQNDKRYDNSIQTTLKKSKITTITLEGMVLNESKENNTSRIQLFDCDGNLTHRILTISNKLIASSTDSKLAIPASKHELILSYWFREIMENDDEYYLVDHELSLLILLYSSYDISIRLTRPLSLGTGNDMHHLHIRQIEVYTAKHECCILEFRNASQCVMNGYDGKDPKWCIDGDKSIGSINHSDFSNRALSNSESHWMEFAIDNDKCPFITDVYDIAYIMIYNRDDSTYAESRLQGSILQLMSDGKVFRKWTLNKTKREYKFQVE